MWRIWRLFIVGVLLAVLFLPLVPPLPVQAATSVDVTVTWTPVTGLVAVYVTDFRVDLDWTMPAGAVNALLRVSDNAYPMDVTDGNEVYYGGAIEISDTAVNFYTSLDTVYYAIWFYDVGDNLLPETYTAEVEGESVSDLVTQVTNFNTIFLPQLFGFLVVVVLTCLAFSKDSIIAYVLCAPVNITYGLFVANAADENYQWIAGVVIAIIGTGAIFKVVMIGFDEIKKAIARRG